MTIKRVTLAIVFIAISVLLVLVVGACSNSPPVINRISLDNSWVIVSSTTEVSCEASDPNGGELIYDWSATGGDISSHSSVATWTAPDKPGMYSIMVSVRDGQNNETVDQIFVCVSTDFPPVIDSLLIEPSSVGEGQQATVTCHAYDPEGDELLYQWEAEDGDLSGTGPAVNWVLPYDKEVSVIRVNVTDQQGESATMVINVNILPNHDPEIESLTSQPRSSLTPGTECTVQCVASDVDGDELEYYWAVSSGTIFGYGAQAFWTAPEDCGRYDISVTVKDGRHGETMKSLRLTVAKAGG